MIGGGYIRLCMTILVFYEICLISLFKFFFLNILYKCCQVKKKSDSGWYWKTYNFFIGNSVFKAFLFLSILTSLGGYGVGFRYHYSSGNVKFIFIIKLFAYIQGVPRNMKVSESFKMSFFYNLFVFEIPKKNIIWYKYIIVKLISK